MNIRKIAHQFRFRLKERTETDIVVIHHSAGTDLSAEAIHTMHMARKTSSGSYWAGIGYHFVIRKSGAIEEGRPVDKVGAHAGPGNWNSIGICLTGNFDKSHPTEEQLHSLVWLIKDHLKPMFGPLGITGHKEHMRTSCPGKYFPMERVRDLILSNGREEKDDMTRYKRLQDMPAWMQRHVREWVEDGIIAGDNDGNLNLTDDMIRMLIFVERMLAKK